MTARTGGLTATCPHCGAALTLWGSDAPHGFSHPVSNCENCLIIIDTGS
jgi:uncharacterized protein (DUF983 family)